MEKLAVEILAEIFGMAFTDGGYTARSVALVNKHFNAVSLPLRYNYVALEGSDGKFEKFLEGFMKVCEGYKGASTIRVRHLFLDANISAASIYRHQGPREKSPVEEISMTILRTVADGLETLTCANFAPEIMQDLAAEPLRFPKLRELTVSSPVSGLLRSNGINPSMLDVPFPVLERLHIACAGMKGWNVYAPNLKYLRLSALNDGFLYNDVINSMKSEEGSPFSRLSTLILQVEAYPSGWLRLGEPSAEHEHYVEELWASQAESDIPVYFLPPLQRLDIRACWKSRIEGGEGCWAVEERYARATYATEDSDTLPEYLQAPPLGDPTPSDVKHMRGRGHPCLFFKESLRL
ncbi:hypothetical protein C8Q70DRAFT_42978 [Cubamyces menziesii]|uniref:Uncharacterized protein n=1 Tax=Trametes cubensis TaxID=1111947 RepID=A0AAD7TSH0_9APHY|nr:hypothetical protein C8Q70DRAFT_42978 [Cubamyces menziesii]KAJ8480853.1 hypothetical protein ONZ51_g6386 [Trametes cubensis]